MSPSSSTSSRTARTTTTSCPGQGRGLRRPGPARQVPTPKSQEGGGLAAGLDLRLPTADETELLGSGATQAKLYLIASGSGKRFSPHVNLGYTFSRGGSAVTGPLPDEINYTAGFDAALHRRITFTADIIGRTLRDFDRIVKFGVSWEFTHGFGRSRRDNDHHDYPCKNNSHAAGVVGLKLNPFGKLLLSGTS